MTMPLVAWNAAGDIVEATEQTMARDPERGIVGVLDFAANEREGIALRDIFVADGAVGSGTWPEFLPANRWHEFRVELVPGWSRSRIPADTPYRIRALIHRASGHRRARPTDVAGSLHRPVELDDLGRDVPQTQERGTPGHLRLAAAEAVTPDPVAPDPRRPRTDTGGQGGDLDASSLPPSKRPAIDVGPRSRRARSPERRVES